MRHVRVPLRLHEALHAHRAGDTDAREIVAAEVDKHDVLRAILLRREQRLGVALTRRDRPRDRVERRVRSLALHDRLRRAADERDVVELEEEQIRRRIDASERAIELGRGRGRGADRALRDDDLEDVALADVLLRALDPAQVLVPVGVALKRPSVSPCRAAAQAAARRARTRRRRGPRRRRVHGRSGRGCRARGTGSPGSRGRRPGAARSARAWRPCRSRGSRRRARRAARPPRTRRSATRGRRTSTGRGGRARPIPARTPRARLRAGEGMPRAG